MMHEDGHSNCYVNKQIHDVQNHKRGKPAEPKT
jgi:hypothetical protein